MEKFKSMIKEHKGRGLKLFLKPNEYRILWKCHKNSKDSQVVNHLVEKLSSSAHTPQIEKVVELLEEQIIHLET